MHRQGSEAWLQDRLGKITSSRFKDAMGTPAKRKSYANDLIVERLYGESKEVYESAAMRWGTANEDAARRQAEIRCGFLVDEIGFIIHPKHPFVGASPDGLIEFDEGIEIKCPYNPINHLLCFTDGMPEIHVPQVQGCMWVTGRERWHFISYDPRAPEELRLYHQIIDRDQELIDELEEAVLSLDSLVTETCAAIQRGATTTKEESEDAQ